MVPFQQTNRNQEGGFLVRYLLLLHLPAATLTSQCAPVSQDAAHLTQTLTSRLQSKRGCCGLRGAVVSQSRVPGAKRCGRRQISRLLEPCANYRLIVGTMVNVCAGVCVRAAVRGALSATSVL